MFASIIYGFLKTAVNDIDTKFQNPRCSVHLMMDFVVDMT